MFRLRRYRVFLAFSIITILAFIHFSGIKSWKPASIAHQPAAKPQEPSDEKKEDTLPKANDNSKPHSIVPEDPSRAGAPANDFTPPVKNNQESPSTVVVVSSFTTHSTEGPPRTTIAPAQESPLVPQNDIIIPEDQGRLEVPNLDRSQIRWTKLPEHFPISSADIIPLPTGTPKEIPKVQFDFPAEDSKTKAIREQKLALIKESIEHSWDGYRSKAWGHDELQPVFGGVRDPFMGWGATLVDSLDTLWIAGMKKEFEEAVEAVKKIDFKTSQRKNIPLFETVIRYLGGLIGAYDISGGEYSALLDKAVELAEILMGAFDTPNRMPITYYMWAPTYASQPHRASFRAVLAEIGSLSVEFTRLAQITKEDRYYDAIARITNELEKWQDNTTIPGLWPSHVDASGCLKKPQDPTEQTTSSEKTNAENANDAHVAPPVKPVEKRETQEEVNAILKEGHTEPANYNPPTVPPANIGPPSKINMDDDRSEPIVYDCAEQGLQPPPNVKQIKYTLGALADSTYEYLPKEYAMLGGLNDQYKTMYRRARDASLENLFFRPMLPNHDDILFHASISTPSNSSDKDEYAYKYEASHLGCFAGGTFGLGAKLFGLDDDLDIAAKLTEGCVWAYNSTATGIMPEHFAVLPCESLKGCEWNQSAYYDAIDPFEDERKSQLQLFADKKKEIEKMEKDNEVGNTDGPALSPSPAVDTIPSPTLPSHAQFAETRIKESRLPPGMTDIVSTKYILRPEAIESVFIMYRITGDEAWREKGWAMFKAVEQNTRTELANSGIKDVTSNAPLFNNEMESFWLGETLKYFYLLFSDPSVVSLDEYVLNTEAHPHKRPTA